MNSPLQQNLLAHTDTDEYGKNDTSISYINAEDPSQIEAFP
jgi:hypothetical protein